MANTLFQIGVLGSTECFDLLRSCTYRESRVLLRHSPRLDLIGPCSLCSSLLPPAVGFEFTAETFLRRAV